MSEWAWQKSKLLGKIKDENANIRLSDKFASVEIDAEKLAILKNKLTRIQSVKSAFLMSQEFQHKEGNLVLLGIKSKGKELEDINEIETILRGLKLNYFVIDLNIHFLFTKHFKKVSGSEIYRR